VVFILQESLKGGGGGGIKCSPEANAGNQISTFEALYEMSIECEEFVINLA
jgi:hypothetical protein